MSVTLLSMAIRHEQDVVAVRQKARQVAAAVGFDGQDQTRIATAISELARNAFMYARGGAVEFLVEGQRAPQLLVIRVSDRGPGIADVDAVLSGRYRSQTGMGLGTGGRTAPGRPVRGDVIDRRGDDRDGRQAVLATGAASSTPPSCGRSRARWHRPRRRVRIEEIRQQNQELIGALEQLRQRQEDLSRLNAELEDTNRGVVALYAELDEKADTLRRADELKSRFLSNMSHEFRTPLNSMRALSALLLDDRDSPLTAEQRRQVGYIRQAADDLSELVNDLPRPRGGGGGQDGRAAGGVRSQEPLRRPARHAAPAARERVGGPRVRGAGRRAAPAHGRGQGVADPAQLPLERAQVSPSAARSG